MGKKLSFCLSQQLLIVMLLLLAFSSVISAAPLRDAPVIVTQPDGTVLKCLASGDEFFNYLHDASGNIIIQHPVTGYYTYAQLDDGGKIVASQQIAVDFGYYYNQDAVIFSPTLTKGRGLKLGDIDFSLNQDLLDHQDLPKEIPVPVPFGARSQESAPNTSPDIGIKGKTVAGSMENIIVLLCFADEDPQIAPDIKNRIEDLFNGPNLSLKHYMKAVSENVFELNSILVGLDGNTLLMYQDSHPRCYYQPYNEVTNPLGYTDNQYIEREQTLLSNAVKAIDGSSIFEGKDLDIDGNGQVDSITFIASGNVDGWADLLWPHKWILFTETVNLCGKQVMSYSFQLLDYLFPPDGDSRLNVICHESLHTFGLPDLYRYNYDGEPVGNWDIMASNIPQTQFPNSHLRLRYAGWGQELVKITKNDRYTLSPLGSTDGVTAYAIQSSSPNQFILLEYRSEENPSGYDTLYDSGIYYHKGLTITRINTNFIGNANQIGATDDEVYIYRPKETTLNQGEGDIEEASLSADTGRISFGNDSVEAGYADMIYLYDGKNSKYTISNLSEAGETISFDLRINDGIAAQTPEILIQPQGAIYGQGAKASALTVLAAIGDGGTLSYQWYSNSVNSTAGGMPLAADSSTYIPPTETIGTTYYYVVITNSNKGVSTTKIATITSEIAEVTVTDAFIPVTDIIKVEKRGMAGVPLALGGMVIPEDANYQDIIWTVKDPGSTTATIEGGVLFATAPGTALVTATVENGQSRTYVTDFSSDGSHTMAIKNDGSLWAWGDNTYGQLGDGAQTNSYSPIRVGTDDKWLTVEAAAYRTTAIKNDGTLWAWGDNRYAKLGIGTYADNNYSPVQIGTDSDWAAIAPSGIHGIALKEDGSLWAWGDNRNGQLGIGDISATQLSPVRVGTDKDWAAIATGWVHNIALKKDGSLWAWGDNSYGQLGDGSTEQRDIPVRIGTDTDWVAIEGGHFHTIALKSDGSLWIWGLNNWGQLGDGRRELIRDFPEQLGEDKDWVEIAGGYFYTMALKSDGSLWAWGDNFVGQLGDGTSIDRFTPVQVSKGKDWTAIACNGDCSVALKNDGSLWNWGWNNWGQLGDGTSKNRRNPLQITFAPAYSKNFLINVLPLEAGFVPVRDIIDLPAQATQRVALALTGTVLPADATNKDIKWRVKDPGTTGGNIEAGLLNTTAEGTVIVTATVERGLEEVALSAAKAGGTYSVILKSDGSLWAWGANDFGQLGDGTLTGRNLPVRVGGDKDWAEVMPGQYHNLALKSDGSLWAWGLNNYGQLGDGSNQNRNTPVRIGEDADWRLVAAGDYHTMAIKNDGSLWAWGDNSYGQLGNGTNAGCDSPVRVGEDNDWLTLEVGDYHTMAIKNDGSLWIWGNNYYGQLGDDTYVDSFSPLQLGNDNDWAAVAAGFYHSMALKNDGSLWAWGDNFYGQLGDGTGITERSIPVLVGTGWDAIFSKGYHNAGFKSDGSLWTWGDNIHGQLGDGTTSQRNRPVLLGTGWIGVCAGYDHTIAQKSDGSLWAWGWNYYGQLGDGSSTSRSLPCQIIPTAAFTKDFTIEVTSGAKVNLKGTIKSYNPAKPTTLRLIQNKEDKYLTSIMATSGSGLLEEDFIFTGITPGTYDLVISKDAHTKFTALNIVVGDEDLDLTDDKRPEVRLMALRCGDINNDGLINDADLTVLWRAGNYNKKTGEADNLWCDLDGDGLINDADLTILWLAYNYNRGEVIIP